jgi:RNA polymerase sigma-70 factor (ECF subfamily)
MNCVDTKMQSVGEADDAAFVTAIGELLPKGRLSPAPARPAPSLEFLWQIEEEIPFLRRAVRRWHRDKPDADDLVQDTLLQALANAHLWQPGSDLRGWLFTIMRNRFLAAATRSTRLALVLGRIAAADQGPPSASGELPLILHDLAVALRRLPGNQRSAVTLIGVEGKSYGEAAHSMGTSVGAVRSHLARGRDRLKSAVRGTDTRPPFAPRPAAIPPAAPPALEHPQICGRARRNRGDPSIGPAAKSSI